MRDPDKVYKECDDGWSKLTDPLIDLCKLYGVRVMQIKEKFGGLRFYIYGERAQEIQDVVDAVEAASYHTCEMCGENGIGGWDKEGKPLYKATVTKTGWMKTLCEPCRAKREAERSAKGLML